MQCRTTMIVNGSWTGLVYIADMWKVFLYISSMTFSVCGVGYDALCVAATGTYFGSDMTVLYSKGQKLVLNIEVKLHTSVHDFNTSLYLL